MAIKVGDQVRYRERIATVLKIGGGRAFIQLYAPTAKDRGRRWVKISQIVRDHTRMV